MSTFAGWHQGNLTDIAQPDYVFLGCPYDFGGTTAKGQADAPDAIRHVSTRLGWNPALKVDVGGVSAADMGNVPVTPMGPEESWELMVECMGNALGATKTAFFIGGDDSINLAVLQAYSTRDERPRVLHFDAHPDYLKATHGEEDHATWVRDAMRYGYMSGLEQIGVRAISGSDAKAERKIQKKIKRLNNSTPDVGAPVHIAIDLDVLDPAFAPGVAVPEPFGMSSVDLLNELWLTMRGFDVRSVSITEHVPSKDPSGATSRIAFALIAHIVAMKELRQ